MNRFATDGEDASDGCETHRPPEAEGLGVLSAAGRHVGLVLLVTCVWCLAAAIHLRFAPRAYTTTAKMCAENSPRILSGDERRPAPSAGYVAQQCEVIKSAPVLRNAIARLAPGDRASLAGAGDPVEFLKKGLDVSVNKKDDVIVVGFESPDAQQGARVVDSVVTAYLDHRAGQQQAASGEVLRILRNEMAAREADLAVREDALVEFGRSSGLALSGEKTDVAAQQLGRLWQALTEAQLATIAAQTNCDAIKALASEPDKIRHLAESLGLLDRQALPEFLRPDLVAERGRLEAELASLRQELTDEHPSVQGLEGRLAAIASEQARQAGDLAERCVDAAHQRLQAAQTREAGIRQGIQEQQQISRQSNADLARYTLLQGRVRQAERLCDVVRSRTMEAGAAQEAGATDVRIIEPAYTGPAPTSPKTAACLAVAGGVGLMLGTLLALFRDRRRRRAKALSRGAGRVDTIGQIPLVSAESGRRTLGRCVSLLPASDLAGAYRSVAAELHFRCRDAKSLMLTSPTGAVGATTLACNLAQILAQSGKRTLLVDAAFHRPSLHEVLRVDGRRGLAQVLRGDVAPRQAVVPTSVEDLDLLPAGPDCDGLAKDLAGRSAREIIRTLSESYDAVLIDAPPVACWARSGATALLCDGTILVATVEQTLRGTVEETVGRLTRSGASVVGEVVSPALDSSEVEADQPANADAEKLAA